MKLDETIARRFVTAALGHVTREYPNKLDHVLDGPEDAKGPRALHPIFYGSFDWHSCVHGHWLLATLHRLFPSLPETDRIRATFDASFTPENVALEVAYLARPSARGFERPYGWAWLLALAAELARHETEHGQRWSKVLRPLTDAFVARFMGHLPKLTYPIRAGTHANTAFAIALALEWPDPALSELLRTSACSFFEGDRDCQAWEPNGDDFLSPALIEAECMRRVLDEAAFAKWLGAFLPRLAHREPKTLFVPATVSDRTDGKIAHLDGVNFTRAWCFRGIAKALQNRALEQAAEDHLHASLPHVTGDYMGEHWLATFALLALLA